MRRTCFRFSSWLEEVFRWRRKLSRSQRLPTRYSARLELESLEPRLVLSGYSVTSNSASAATVGSLVY